jgi:hypothetical protein
MSRQRQSKITVPFLLSYLKVRWILTLGMATIAISVGIFPGRHDIAESEDDTQ